MNDSDDNISDFFTASKEYEQSHILEWAKANLALKGEAEEGAYLLPYATYSDYSGTAGEVANSRVFQERYPGVVQTANGGYGTVWTYVTEESLRGISEEDFERLQEDVQRIKNYWVLDDEVLSEVEMEAQEEAWDDYLKREFLGDLQKRFVDDPEAEPLLEELAESKELRSFFEQERQDAGEEYYIEEGMNVGLHMDKIVNSVELDTIRRFLHPEPENQLDLGLREHLFEQLLEESHDYSCVMAPAPPKIANAVINWGKMNIDDDDLYDDEEEDKGREDEVHVTVKYGLTEGQPSEELLRIIEETQPFDIEIGTCSIFEAPEYDVVKFSVESRELRKLNARVSELPHEDQHPKYRPHMTVAYVRKGSCNDLVGKRLFDTDIPAELTYRVKALQFSCKGEDGEKSTLFLGRPNLEPAEAFA